MLILSRRVRESLKIGDDVTVTVLSTRGDQVRLGFAAPSNVDVNREEVYERIQASRGVATLRSVRRRGRVTRRSPGAA